MTETNSPSNLRRTGGIVLLLVGVLVFAIRFQHEGPYALPRDGNLRAGVLALLLGGLWLRPWPIAPGAARSAVTAVAAIASVVVLFFALYATLAELEEVIVLRADQGETRGKELRLWVVDFDGKPWVTMPSEKAERNQLTDARAEMLRNGAITCVIPRLFNDREAVDRSHRLRSDKYAIQRLATAIGVFGDGPGPNTVTFQLEPCAR